MRFTTNPKSIESGDPRPRVFINIEAATDDIDPANIEMLHDYIVGHVDEWFMDSAALVVTNVYDNERMYDEQRGVGG